MTEPEYEICFNESVRIFPTALLVRATDVTFTISASETPSKHTHHFFMQ
jgi:hypothetical protein